MKKITVESICPKCKSVYINQEIISYYGNMAVDVEQNNITHCPKCNRKLVSKELLDNFFDEKGDFIIKYYYMELENTDSWDICVAVRDLITKIDKCIDSPKFFAQNICETIPIEESDKISLINSYFVIFVEISGNKYEIAKVKLYSYFNQKWNRAYNGFKNKEICAKTLAMTNIIFEGTIVKCGGISNLEEMYFMALSNKSMSLEQIPENIRTEQMYLEVAKDGSSASRYLSKIPERYLTEEWYVVALESQGIELLDVPEKMRTHRVIMEALKAKGIRTHATTSILNILPESMLTKEFCKEAVRLSPDELEYVPPKVLDEEICLAALNNTKDKTKGNQLLKYIPVIMLTDEMCRIAVRNYASELRYVPEKMRTIEICLEAIKQDGNALNYVPEGMRTNEIYLEAVKQNGNALNYVPEEMRTNEICLEAVKQDGNALNYVPEEMRTNEICLEAVKRAGRILKYVSEEKRTEEICLEAVKQDGRALRNVPEDKLTAEIYLEAVKQNRKMIDMVPEELQTEEMKRIAEI